MLLISNTSFTASQELSRGTRQMAATYLKVYDRLQGLPVVAPAMIHPPEALNGRCSPAANLQIGTQYSRHPAKKRLWQRTWVHAVQV